MARAWREHSAHCASVAIESWCRAETIGVADPEPALREALGDADFAVAYDEGRRMAMETALETDRSPARQQNDARVTRRKSVRRGIVTA